MAIKTVTCMITGILVGLWIWVMGMEFAVLWGFIAFLLNYIPFVGSIIAAIPAIILALAQQGFGVGLTLAIGYIVINIGVSNFLEPVLMGRRLGLSPLVVFLSLVFWGFVWGPAGMLLSVPLTMIIKILLEHSHDFRWIAVLMDVRPVQEKD
ncbi:MAG: AI-2E family transporter [Candidatus Dadabacteria bacterium]|nr:MAG: AI-2E family transporter [Candidatus Dadabacteria bacterium]